MTVIITTGLASTYLWYLLARADITAPILNPLRASRANTLIGCAWCAGFWITGAVMLCTDSWTFTAHLAAATIVGILGALSE